MENITIAQVKTIREQLGVPRLVLFAFDEHEQQVATHGLEEQDARVAAEVGNQLKSLLQWPEEDCQAVPLPRVCERCTYYKPSAGYAGMLGGSGPATGICLVEPKYERVGADHGCRHFQPNQ